jgi:hypothetical protein
LRIVLPSRAAAYHLANFLTAFIHSVDGDIMGKTADPRGQLNVLVSCCAWDALAIPAFMYLRKRKAD